MVYRIPHVVASDTVMLWTPDDHGHHLVSAVAQFVNLAMTFQVPLRGAIAFGDCIFDLQKEIFIGFPVVEALEAEKVQEWIGVGVLPTAAERLSNDPRVVKCTVPVKPKSNVFLNHAVAWHRADDDPSAPAVRVQGLLKTATDETKLKYLNTLEFIQETGEDACGVSSSKTPA